VSERLPDMGVEVLIYGPPDFGYRLDELSEDTEGLHWESCECSAVGDMVTHWKPLAAPSATPESTT
jgi:hypothetical protein